MSSGHLALDIRVLHSPLEKALLLVHRDLAKNICFFAHESIAHRTFIVALANKKIVGMASLAERSHRVPGAMGLCFVSTHLAYRNRGVATALAGAVFAYARAKGKAIANTAYEALGEKHLKPVLTRVALAFPDVALIEH